MSKEKILKFPKDFLWGVSTSAYQIEGGALNDWSQWEMSEKRLAELRRKKLDYRDFVAGRACDSYNRYHEDIKLVKDLNCNAYRMSLEWARLEPREGEFDREAVEHYRRVLSLAKQSGLKTVLTIWHWTNPMWLVAEGGWSNKKVVGHFARYTDFVVRELGDLVDYWVTLNEPTVHARNGYINGKFPPNKRNHFLAFRVMFNLIGAHKRAYKIIHEIDPKAKVSVTFLDNDYEPARHWFLPEVVLAWFARHLTTGILTFQIKKQLDYIGLDFYFHIRLVWHPPFFKNENKLVNDMGWEIYPKGIYHILKYLHRYKKPIIIMENGLADADDSRRADFIREHLRFVHRAISEGVDVRGYFHWSLLDNFEWADGWAPKFGLYAVDRRTFARTPRPSAAVYAEICRTNQLSINDRRS